MLAVAGSCFMKIIYLVRHMETAWNEQQRYIGITDLPLSPNGLKNAQLLAEALKDKAIKKVFSSNMLRAKQTAQILASQFSCPVITEPLLNEVNFGDWEGLTFNEIALNYRQLSQVWLTNPFAVNIPAGESWEAFLQRVKKGWERVKTQAVNESVLVTHAGCIKLILSWELKLDLTEGWQIKQDKGAVNILALNETKGSQLLALNDTGYRRAFLKRKSQQRASGNGTP